jgi:hypothetical protein
VQGEGHRPYAPTSKIHTTIRAYQCLATRNAGSPLRDGQGRGKDPRLRHPDGGALVEVPAQTLFGAHEFTRLVIPVQPKPLLPPRLSECMGSAPKSMNVTEWHDSTGLPDGERWLTQRTSDTT